ncbi:tyrosine-protein kinase RYK-like [Saccostrea echinata]|uniref:tyrosine-protein kinase RYK-like n=1 Tax=Saccostrea echinata TaxID=191078 RepID=UPI002A831425|nr:tyrosine-protein kinase RYK-like [Saccostrea echinata]
MKCFLVATTLTFLGFVTVCKTDLDLYLDAHETYRLLGVNAELYYVRKGIVNNYALSFILPIHPDVQEIVFTWRSLRQGPPDIYYNMSFEVSNPRAMLMPVANISNTGKVPNSLSVFSITFPCTGNISADVEVVIQMNISIFSASNISVLNFKRKKTCLMDSRYQKTLRNKLYYNKIQTIPPHLSNLTHSHVTVDDATTNVKMSTRIFYITVGCACAVIILIAMAVAIYYLNTQKGNNRGYSERIKYYDSTSSQQLSNQQSQSFLRSETPVESSYKGSSVRNYSCGPSPIPECFPPDPREILQEVAIEHRRIALGELQMEGTFGRIYQGTILSETVSETEIGVDQGIMIKTVSDQARPDQVHLFLTESCMMMGIIHQNIYPVIGACIESGQPPYVIYPYSSEGNLKKFLLKCRVSETGSHYSLSTQQLVYLAIQIVKAIQFLHRKKILHKDIATRNCVIDNDLQLKLTDNSLSRDLFPADYHCLGDNENRPVKWLSLEALVERRFSINSDVWSFGVALWELMSLAQQPYSEIDCFEMAAYLREGYRIAHPINCPDELYSMMSGCWAKNPDERPRFSQLLVYLQNFYEALGQYI